MAELGKARDERESLIDIGELLVQTHGHHALVDLGRSLGVKRNEVDGNGLASRGTLPRVNMLQKVLEKQVRLLAARAGAGRSADFRFGQRRSHAGHSVVIEL